MTGFIKTLFLLNNRWHVWERGRRVSSSQPKLGSIVCIDRNAKGFAPWLIFVAMLLTACTRAPAAQPSPTQPSTPPVETISFGDSAEGLPADEALRALVFAERTAAHARDLEALAQLWAHDAQIIDRRSVDNPADDYRWQGRDAILDRYILAVFPAPPPLFEQPPSLDITFSGDRATATLGRDRWRFTFTEGRWWLQELAY